MRRFYISCLFCCFVLAPSALFAKNAPTYPRDWVPYNEINLNLRTNIAPYCSGRLIEPDWPGLHPASDDPLSFIKIKAKSLSEDIDKNYLANGNVLLGQGKVQVEADTIYFNPLSTKGTLDGNIYLRLPGIAIESELGDFHLGERSANLFDSTFVMHEQNYTGSAKSTHIRGSSYQLGQATITPCNPTEPVWSLATNNLKVNKDKGRAEAMHARLNIRGVPVLYMPYISFPIDDRRQSGFLPPLIEFGLGDANFESLAFPYYWNLHPQLDNTFTPLFQQDHDWFFKNETRYLNKASKGQIDINWSEDGSRWQTAFTHHHDITNSIWLDIDWFDISDTLVPIDYYKAEDPVDFTRQKLEITHKKSNKKYSIKTERWQLVSGYEELTDLPYSSYPELTIEQTTNLGNNQTGYWDLDITNFRRTYSSDQKLLLNTDNGETTEGWRESLVTRYSKSFKLSAASIKTSAEFNMASYQLKNPGLGRPLNTSWFTPRAIIDGSIPLPSQSLVASWNNRITPRIQYIYTPYTSMYKSPLFNTSEIDFNQSQLFNTRRFRGLDRFGDMNRVSLGLNDVLTHPNSVKRIDYSVGQIYRIQPELMGLTQDNDPETQEQVSPVYSNLTLTYNSALKFSLIQDWNPSSDRFERQIFNAQYRPAGSALLNFSLTDEFDEDTNEWQDSLHFSSVLPIFERWGLATAFDYNKTDHQFEDTLFGVEYDGCCWNLRLVAKLAWQDANINIPTKNSFYLQLYLKGLGQNNELLDEVLAERISGYQGRLYP